MYRIRSLRAERGHQHTVTLSMCGRHAIRYCYAGRVVRCSQSSNADAIRYPRGMELHKTAARIALRNVRKMSPTLRCRFRQGGG